MKRFWFKDVHAACAWAREHGYWVDSTLNDWTTPRGDAFSVMMKKKVGGRVFPLTRWLVARQTFLDLFR